jgi:hypothetical protein
VLKENQNIVKTQLNNCIFLPYIFSFDAIVENDFNKIINANQNGYIEFTYKSNTFKGFIKEIGINPAHDSVYTFKLIAHFATDLTLI